MSMQPSVLLLDCEEELSESLSLLGYEVDAGTMGYATGERYLPCQIYEKNIIIYAPTFGADAVKENVAVKNRTPEYACTEKIVLEHLQRRKTTLLVFIDPSLPPYLKNRAFSWIPLMPKLHKTRDTKIRQHVAYSVEELKPVIDTEEVRIPVEYTIGTDAEVFTDNRYQLPTYNVYSNHAGEALGSVIKLRDGGRIIVLPSYKKNAAVIKNFMQRVVPKIYDLDSYQGMISSYTSPEENRIAQELEKYQSEQSSLEETIENTRKDLAAAKLNKAQVVQADETASTILAYFNRAIQNTEDAIFYLYKVTEYLQNQMGGEKVAKEKLGCAEAWNIIGRCANESYRDGRHAPKPEDKVEKLTEEEEKACFTSAVIVIHAYLDFLFNISEE